MKPKMSNNKKNEVFPNLHMKREDFYNFYMKSSKKWRTNAFEKFVTPAV